MDVINLSIGEPEVEPTRDLIALALDAAARAGVVPVVAAGNDFDEFGEGSLASPGSSAEAITVGASTSGAAPSIAASRPPGRRPSRSGSSPTSSHPARRSSRPPPTGGGRHPGRAWRPTRRRGGGAPPAAPSGLDAPSGQGRAHDHRSPARRDSSRRPASARGSWTLPRRTRLFVLAAPTSLSFGLVACAARLTSTGRRSRTRVAERVRGAVTVEKASWPEATALDRPSRRRRPRAPRVQLGAGIAEGEADGGAIVLSDGRARDASRSGARCHRTQAGRTRTGSDPPGGLTGRHPREGRARSVTIAIPRSRRRLVRRASPRRPRAGLPRPAHAGRCELRGRRSPRAAAESPSSPGRRRRATRTGSRATPRSRFNLNPYLVEFSDPVPVGRCARPLAGAYDSSSTARRGASAGAFTFRSGSNDVTPPKATLVTRAVRSVGGDSAFASATRAPGSTPLARGDASTASETTARLVGGVVRVPTRAASRRARHRLRLGLAITRRRGTTRT